MARSRGNKAEEKDVKAEEKAPEATSTEPVADPAVDAGEAKMEKAVEATETAAEAPAKEEKKKGGKKGGKKADENPTALATVDTPPTAPAVHMTQEEQQAVRQRVLDLRDKIDEEYAQLADNLWTVYDRALYVGWGYESWREYVDKELKFGLRKAQYLVSIVNYFKNTLPDGSGEKVRERVAHLGWTKVKELVGVVTHDNVDEWVKKCEGMNAQEVADEAKRYLTEKSKAGKEDLGEEGERKIAKAINFKLEPDKFANVEAALRRAAEMSGTENKNANLDLIATDFLAGNEFSKDGRSAIGTLMSKFEERLGVRIVVVDKASMEVLHGADVLEDSEASTADASKAPLANGADAAAE